MFNRTSNIGEIVSKFPRATDIFRKYDIDFCCGGHRPLGEALAEKNLAADEVIGALNRLYANRATGQEDETDWRDVSSAALIEHIVATHHAFLRTELPNLSVYVEKIKRVHGARRPELMEVHALFHRMKEELEQHLCAEETDVFPHIVAYEQAPTAAKLTALRQTIVDRENEHTATGDILKQIRAMTNGFEPPQGACTTYRATYGRLAGLEADLFQHIHLENNILFLRYTQA